MKKKTRHIILGTLGLMTLLALSFFLYFYIALSGNPLDRWQEKGEVLRFYEERYGREFEVVRSDYSYKRKEFSFRLSPVEDPNLVFSTTLQETTRLDAYAAERCRQRLREVVEEAFSSDFDDLMYRLNIHERHNAQGMMESDVSERLKRNEYVIYLSWETDHIDEEAIDALMRQMGERITSRLDIPVGRLTLGITVNDGPDYHHVEEEIAKDLSGRRVKRLG